MRAGLGLFRGTAALLRGSLGQISASVFNYAERMVGLTPLLAIGGKFDRDHAQDQNDEEDVVWFQTRAGELISEDEDVGRHRDGE